MKLALSMQMAHLIAHLLIAANIFALIIGVLMISMPHRLGALFKVSDRWVSTKRTFEPLDIAHDTDQRLFRWPRTLGTLLVACSVYVLVRGGMFAWNMDAAEGGRLLAKVFGGRLPAQAWEVLWITTVSLLLLGAIMALVLGILSFYRLQTLKRWSTFANRWVATHHLFEPLDAPNYTLNRIVHDKSRQWGILVTVCAICALVLLFWYLRRW